MNMSLPLVFTVIISLYRYYSMLNNTKLCIFFKTVIKLCYMNWHLVKLYAMKIKCKTFVIPLSIFQNVFTVICPFL